MTVFDILGLALLGFAGVVIVLRAFRVLDWSWPSTFFPLLLFLIYEIVMAVVAGVGNWLGYMDGIIHKLSGQ